MTRGRPPQKALDDALLIAKARGDLLVFKEKPAFECDYMFLSADKFCIVRVKRTRHLWCTPEDLEAQCIETIEKFRHIHSPAFLSREIWFWSQNAVFRFFRIEDAGLVELDRDGKILTAPQEEPIKGKQNASQQVSAGNG
jgi:hypothetical protein